MLEIITEDDPKHWMEMPNVPISRKVDQGFAAEAARRFKGITKPPT